MYICPKMFLKDCFHCRYKFLSNSDVRSLLHWHSLPVRHLAFTAEGKINVI